MIVVLSLALVLIIIALCLTLFDLVRVINWAIICYNNLRSNSKYLRSQNAEVVPRLVMPWSHSLIQPILDLLNRIKSADQLVEDKNLTIERIEQILSRARELQDGSDDDHASLCERYLSVIHQHFKSSACALVYYASSRGNFEVHSIGVTSRRFETHLKQYLSNFLDLADDSYLGLLDGLSSQSLLGDFTLFGYRYSLSIPVLNGKSRSARAVLWLGYSEERPPSELEVKLASQIAGRVGRELASLGQLALMSVDVERAEQRDREKSDFIAHMSHDIRSPLHNIRAILTLLQSEQDSGSSNDLLDAALRNCQSMGEIVDDLLDYSKFRVGKLAANPTAFDINKLVRDIIDGYTINAKLKGLNLIFNSADAPYFVDADQKQIRRVISNLLSNALKYTEQGGVEIRVELLSEDQCAIKVIDSGSGLSPEQQNHLFQAFSRFHKEIDGVGLGLTVAKILAEINLGQINVSSVIGRGSTFELTIPRAKGVVTLKPTHQKSLINLNQKMILLVDDDLDCTTTLSRMLEQWGYQTTSANSVSEAISLCNYNIPDLVITDHSMPDGGSERLISFMRSKYPKTQLAILSGRAADSKLSDITHFTKPLDLDQLKDFLTQIFAEIKQVQLVKHIA